VGRNRDKEDPSTKVVGILGWTSSKAVIVRIHGYYKRSCDYNQSCWDV
jgi:hypothetical protein